MDSFALAQDSDEENNTQHSTSPNTSFSNLADPSLSSMEEKELPPPHHPLEPEIIVSSSPAVLPHEVSSS